MPNALALKLTQRLVQNPDFAEERSTSVNPMHDPRHSRFAKF
jgi:hypothetical protein